MTVTVTEQRVTYTGNGATTNWPYEFQIPELEACRVYLTETATGIEVLLSTEEYGFVASTTDAGGEVIYPLSGSALSSAYKLTVERDTPLKQEVLVTNQSAYYADVVMAVWNKLTMAQQDLAAVLSRTPKLPRTSTVVDPLLPIPVSGAVLIGRADGLGWETGPDAGSIEAVGEAATNALIGSPFGFNTVELLLANTSLSYTLGAGKVLVANGQYIYAGGIRYRVAGPGMTNHAIITAGGVKLHEAGNVFTSLSKLDLADYIGTLNGVATGFPVNAGGQIFVKGGGQHNVPGLAGWKYADNRGALNEIARRASAGKTVVITATGDSTVEGGGQIEFSYNTWPNRLQTAIQIITGHFTTTVNNAGNAGKKIIDTWAIDNFNADVTVAYPATQYVMFCFGLNDVKDDDPANPWDQEVYRLKCSEYIAAIRNAGYVPIMVSASITAAANVRPNKLIQGELLAVQRQIASDNMIDFIDVNSVLQDWQNYGSGSDRQGDLQPDGTHWSDNGNPLIAQAIAHRIFQDRVVIAKAGATFGYPDASFSPNVSTSDDYNVNNHYGYARVITATAADSTAAEIYVWSPRDMDLVYASVDRGGVSGVESVFVGEVAELVTNPIVDVYFGAAKVSTVNRPHECMVYVGRLKFGLNRIRYQVPSAGTYKMGYFMAHDAPTEVVVAGSTKTDTIGGNKIYLPKQWNTSPNVLSLKKSGETIVDTQFVVIDGVIPIGWGAVVASTYVGNDDNDVGDVRRAMSIVVYRDTSSVDILRVLHTADGTIIGAVSVKDTGTGTWGGVMSFGIGTNGANYDMQVRSNGAIVARSTANPATDTYFNCAYGRIGGLWRNDTTAAATGPVGRFAISKVTVAGI